MQLGQGPRDNYLARAVLAQVCVALFQTQAPHISAWKLEIRDLRMCLWPCQLFPSCLPLVNVPIPSEVGKVPEQVLLMFLVAPSSPSPWKWQQAQPGAWTGKDTEGRTGESI